MNINLKISRILTIWTSYSKLIRSFKFVTRRCPVMSKSYFHIINCWMVFKRKFITLLKIIIITIRITNCTLSTNIPFKSNTIVKVLKITRNWIISEKLVKHYMIIIDLPVIICIIYFIVRYLNIISGCSTEPH